MKCRIRHARNQSNKTSSLASSHPISTIFILTTSPILHASDRKVSARKTLNSQFHAPRQKSAVKAIYRNKKQISIQLNFIQCKYEQEEFQFHLMIVQFEEFENLQRVKETMIYPAGKKSA